MEKALVLLLYHEAEDQEEDSAELWIFQMVCNLLSFTQKVFAQYY